MFKSAGPYFVALATGLVVLMAASSFRGRPIVVGRGEMEREQ
jgi:hypothetical protein